MSNKSILAIAIMASGLMCATTASAFDAFFAAEQTQPANDYVNLGNFTSSAAGVVEIFDYRLGVIGESLGSHDTTAGANADFRVQLGAKPLGNVVAVLTINGVVEGMEMIRITDSN